MSPPDPPDGPRGRSAQPGDGAERGSVGTRGPDGPDNPDNPAPAFDRAALSEQLGGDLHLLRRVIIELGRQRQVLTELLERSMTSGDTAGVARMAHTLRGSLLVLAAAPAAAVTHHVEDAAKAGDREALEAAFGELQGHLTRLGSELDALLQKGFGPDA